MNSNVENTKRVYACTTLDELCDELNRINAIVRGDDNTPGDPFAEVDITELPTFGGRDPSYSYIRNIYSWDDTRLLVPAANGSWEIVERRTYYDSDRPDATYYGEKW